MIAVNDPNLERGCKDSWGLWRRLGRHVVPPLQSIEDWCCWKGMERFLAGAWEELEEGGFRRSSIGGQGEVIGTSRGPHAQRTCSIRWMGTILRYRITPHCESPHGQYTIFTLARLTITIILHYIKRCSLLNSKPCKHTTSKRESWLSRLHI